MIRLSSWRWIVLMLIGVSAPSQLSRSTIAAPAAYLDPAYFDDARGVLVCWGTNAMWEYDGSTWVMIPCPVFPSYPSVATAWDPVRRKFVGVDYWLSSSWGLGTTWEWDGLIWLNLGMAPVVPITVPSSTWNHLVTYHQSRQRVMLFSDGGLREWDGSTWTNLSHVNPPPCRVGINQFYSYWQIGYDARWDKIVLFGRTRVTLSPSVSEGTTFEWDAVNDWVQLPSVNLLANSAMWYDGHRGTMVLGYAYGGTPYGFYCRDSARNWVQLQSTSLFLRSGGLDSRRNRYFSIDSPTTIGLIQDTHPASFGSHAQGCTPATAWPLQLSEPWTRAWIGRSMSVDVTAPYSLAILAMGFSDQSYGSTPLPVALGPYGAPGCTLHVAPEATAVGIDLSGTVTFSLPIPNAPGLLGVTFWQQALALAIGANAANLLATDSVRGSVGLFQ